MLVISPVDGMQVIFAYGQVCMLVGVSNPSILAELFVKNAEKSNHENIQPSDLVGHEIYYIMMHLLCYAKLPDPLFKNCMTSPHESN